MLGNKIKPTNERFGLWLLIKNVYNNNNLITNVWYIRYFKVKQKIQEFKLITVPFCDSIMVVKITDFTVCEGDLNKLKY